MGTRIDPDLHLLRDQLVLRRQKLEQAISKSHTVNLVQLLEDVDKALERMEAGSYGLCELCHEPVEAERLLADPLVCFCVDHLTPPQRRALEQDLELAARIQAGLLPNQDLAFGPWRVSYHYEAAGAVSGDYCDVTTNNGDLCFMVGDVSGKGVAASMLMANLHAMFRVLIPAGLPLEQLVERANRIFCESTLPMQFATLVCGKATASGQMEICNAGHVPPLLVSAREVALVETTGLPVGIFCDHKFSTSTVQLTPGDSLVIYTDGISEAQNDAGTQYGDEQLKKLVNQCRSFSPRALVDACVRHVTEFRAGAPKVDDQTLMVVHFGPSASS